MDTKDGPFAASERTTICHINPAAYGIYLLIQHRMTSAYKADSLAITCNGSCPTTCLAVMYYEFLAHSAYIVGRGDERETFQFSERRQAICATLFVTEVSTELVFLLFGQIGLNDLELLPLDRLRNSVHHSPGLQQEQGRGARGDLCTHLVDETLVDAIVRKVPH